MKMDTLKLRIEIKDIIISGGENISSIEIETLKDSIMIEKISSCGRKR